LSWYSVCRALGKRTSLSLKTKFDSSFTKYRMCVCERQNFVFVFCPNV